MRHASNTHPPDPSRTRADELTFAGVSGSGYQAQIAPATFKQPWQGVQWLGPKLITPSMIIAFLWPRSASRWW